MASDANTCSIAAMLKWPLKQLCGCAAWIVEKWRTASTPSTERLTRANAWAQLLVVPVTIVGSIATVLALPQCQDKGTRSAESSEPSTPPASARPASTPASATAAGPLADVIQAPRLPRLRVSRVVVDSKSSHFETLKERSASCRDPCPNPPADLIDLGTKVEDIWVPSPRWYALQGCLAIATTPSTKRRCGSPAPLIPTFDVVVESLDGAPTVLRSLRLVVRLAKFPQGSTPGGTEIPTSAIPKSAAYEVPLHPNYMSSEDGRWRFTSLDLLPPLSPSADRPARFSIGVRYKTPGSPTTALLHFELYDSAGQRHLSPPFIVFLP